MHGDRTQEWKDDGAINPATHGINWPTMGVYCMESEDEELAQVCCHNPFEESVAIKQTPIVKGSHLENNWSDHEAYLEVEEVKHNVMGRAVRYHRSAA